MEGSGDAEGEEEHLDHEPECELVGIVELSFSASTRTKALTLNPPPVSGGAVVQGACWRVLS